MDDVTHHVHDARHGFLSAENQDETAGTVAIRVGKQPSTCGRPVCTSTNLFHAASETSPEPRRFPRSQHRKTFRAFRLSKQNFAATMMNTIHVHTVSSRLERSYSKIEAVKSRTYMPTPHSTLHTPHASTFFFRGAECSGRSGVGKSCQFSIL